MIISKRVNGGALYYAIFVMLLLGLLSVLLLSYFELSFREDTRFIKYTELNDNIQSVLSLLSCQPDLLSENSSTTIDLFSDSLSIVDVKRTRWGFLNKISLESWWQNLNVERSVLMAEMEKERIALWVPARDNYISLVGNSYINGTCYLSALGLRKGSAEGRYFSGPYLHKGNLEMSQIELPELKKQLIDFFYGYKKGDISDTDSLMSYNFFRSNRQIMQSFKDRTLVLNTDRNIILDKGFIDGNVIIISSKNIEVWPSVGLNQCILVAKSVDIKDGFEGRLQVFASDSISIGKGCKLSYPSFVAVISTKPNATVELNDASYINGGLICYSSNPEKGKTKMYIKKEARVIGKAYINGDLTFSGTVTGSLYCDRFVYQTNRAFYENFMIDCSIDESELPNEYASFCITDDVFKLREVQ